MIFTFAKMQSSCKRNAMIDVIYFEGTLSMRKDACKGFPPPPKVKFDSYPTDCLVPTAEIT